MPVVSRRLLRLSDPVYDVLHVEISGRLRLAYGSRRRQPAGASSIPWRDHCEMIWETFRMRKTTGQAREPRRRTPGRMPWLVIAGLLAGCETMGYYAQSIDGHLRLMHDQEPVSELVDAEDTPPGLRERLLLVGKIRDFATRELGLPDNNSYRSYVDIGRSHVVWAVVAAPELSLEAKTWCFLFAGCVSYRGYFSQTSAEAYGDKLAQQGYDVYVGGVPAYSTLGWFDDPLPSSVVYWPEPRLAGLIFHELAHQVVYVKDDSGFNEAFAVTVEREGVRRWLTAQGGAGMKAARERSERFQDDFLDLVFATRGQLRDVYDSPRSDPEKRREKARIFAEMRSRYAQMKAGWEGDNRYDRWFAAGLNNARMASVATYHDLVPGFEALLARHQGRMASFYAEVAEWAELPREDRRRRLASAAHLGRAKAEEVVSLEGAGAGDPRPRLPLKAAVTGR